MILQRGVEHVSEVTCRTFLERYSDLKDGLLPPMEEAAMRRHMVSCGSCCRYDRVVRRGVALLRANEPSPSADFHVRLRQRLERENVLALRRPASYPPYVGGWPA